MRRFVVIGMGNSLLSDDSAGLHVVSMLRSRGVERIADLAENHSGGVDLLFDLKDHECAILVDAVMTGTAEPGHCHRLGLDDLADTRQPRMVDSHGLNLASVWDIGVRHGFEMPREFVVLGVEGRSFTEFSETPGPQVMAGLPVVVEQVEQLLAQWENA